MLRLLLPIRLLHLRLSSSRTIPACLPATVAAVPTLPSTRRRHRRARCLLPPHSPPLAATSDAADEREEKQSADGGANADDYAFVIVDPGLNLAAYRGAFALALR